MMCVYDVNHNIFLTSEYCSFLLIWREFRLDCSGRNVGSDQLVDQAVAAVYCLEMETNIILLLLLSTVTPAILLRHPGLGYPMITLNCTTDYAAPERIIHVSWLLNSRQPIAFRNHIGGMRIQNCLTTIACGSGYEYKNPVCNNEILSNEWISYNIPMNESYCNVTVQYDDFNDFKSVMYPSTEICLFSDPSVEFTVDVHGSSESFTIGDPYEIECAVYTDLVIHSDLVNFTWIGPNNQTILANNGTIIINNRTNVTTTTSVGNNHTSTLRFLYLTEEDQGLYTCHVTILTDDDSESFEVGILIPTPNVSITILNTQTVGSELSLKCDVTTVRGVTSNAEIVWMRNDTAIEEMNNSRISISPTDSNGNSYTSFLKFSYLSEDDESEYTCRVTILDTNTSESVGLNSFNLPLPEVSVTILNQHIGNPLSLRCAVTTVRGITSSVDIVWKVNDTEIIERYNGNVTEEETSYVYYYNANTNLTVNDNNTVYQCQVIINASPLISSTDNLTLNIIAPTDSPSLPPGSGSLSIAVIAVILVIIALIAFMALGIFIALIVCQNKKRNPKIHWSRDEDIKYMPPTDDIPYSVIGKDAPSTCESLGEIQKVTDWIKDAQMPAIDEEYNSESTDQIKDMQISDNDEECDSIDTGPYVTNEEMLDHVCGYNTTGKRTRVDKFSVSTADSGIENEFDNDSNKSLPPQTGLYVSHQAIEDMNNITKDEIELSIPQEGSNSVSNNQVMCNSPNSTSSQPLDNSTLLSKFYNTLIKQKSNESNCDLENNEPAVASLTLHSTSTASSANEGNNNNHNVVLTTNQLLSSSANVGITTTAAVGSYVTDHCNAISTVQLLSYPTNNNTPTTAVDGNNVDCYVASSDTEINSHPLLYSSCTGATTTVKDGSYVDHYAGSNNTQPISLLTHTGTNPSSHLSYKVIGSTGYIDHYGPSCTKTVVTAKAYADHHTPSSNNYPSSQPTYKETGSYIDRYAASNISHPLSYPTSTDTVALAKDGSYVDRHAALDINHPSLYPTSTNTVEPEKTNGFHASSNINQPLSHPTYKGTVSTGSYIDHYTVSNAYQPSAHPTFTDNVAPAKDQNCVHTHAVSCPIYKDTVSTGSYIDYYAASNINQPSPQPTSTGPVAPAKVHASSTTNQPSSYSTYKETVSTGSYVDRYAAPNTYQPSLQHTSSDMVALRKEDGCYVDSHAVLKANQRFPTYKNTVSTGSYVDRYADEQLLSCHKYTDTATTGEGSDNPFVSNTKPKLLCSLNSAALPTTMDSSYVGQSTALSANGNTTTEAEGIYIDRYIASNDGTVSLQSTNSGTSLTAAKDHGDHCVTSDAGQLFRHSIDDSTSAIGSYVDCYMASNNDNTLAKPKTLERSSNQHSSKKKMVSGNSSFIDEDNLCLSPITGVYVPYATAMASDITKNTSAYSTNDKTPAPSTTNQTKRKPADLFLPSNNGSLYGLLNEDKYTFGSSAGEDCDTPNVGEYIAHDDLESLGILNNYTGGKNFVSRPEITPYSTSSQSRANNGYVDYKIAIQQNSPSETANAQQAKACMQQNTNKNFIPSTRICINTNGYVTESDI